MSDLVRSIYYRRRQRRSLFLIKDYLDNAQLNSGSLIFNEESVGLNLDGSDTEQSEVEMKKDIDSI